MGSPQPKQSSTGLDVSRQEIERVLSARCKALNAPIALVGTRTSALRLLKVLQGSEIPLAGVFDNLPHSPELEGQPVQPIEALSTIGSDSIVVVASFASSMVKLRSSTSICASFAKRKTAARVMPCRISFESARVMILLPLTI